MPRFPLLPPTLLLALSALLSRFLGVYRDHLLAHTFGATNGTGIYNLDVYYAAFRIPDMLYSLIVFGALSAAFVPIFSRYKKKEDWQNAWEFASAILHLMLIAMTGIAALCYLFAPFLANLVAGGFPPEKFALTVRLMRILLISPILFGASAVLIGIQDSMKCFSFRSLGPLFYNAGIIAGILWFGQRFGVVGVTWGVVLGAALQLLIQLPALWQTGFQHRWILGLQRADTRQLFHLMIPRFLGLSLTQITLLLNTLIASFLTTGSITIFYFSDNLLSLPMGVIGISFAISSFATLSELATDENQLRFADELRRLIDRILFLIIPATAGMMLLRHEIIDLILTSGQFSARDAALTAQVLFILLFSLFAQSLIPLLSRAFYAHHDTKTPLWLGAASSLFSIIGGYLLAIVFDWGIAGIALATTVDNLLKFTLLIIFLQKKIHLCVIPWQRLSKIIVVTAMMTVVVVLLKTIALYPATDFLTKALLLGLYSAGGAGVYLGIMKLL